MTGERCGHFELKIVGDELRCPCGLAMPRRSPAGHIEAIREQLRHGRAKAGSTTQPPVREVPRSCPTCGDPMAEHCVLHLPPCCPGACPGLEGSPDV